ncbi:hypothetical protein PybrP1_012366 [[Pythium] brassicae (nom. inval.)]|nr:hypothetical protein PybrP1_012366 [[Pythium] brassicae (nom. inval.)]
MRRTLLLLSAHSTFAAPRPGRRVYVIAGEASGDAIGAKVLRALAREQRRRGDARELEVRGIGGPLMRATGAFESLFPMHELSVMGLVERRLQDTLADIRAFRPDVVLTIDSKGFAFRVLKALQADPRTRDAVTRMHYVAPSVWAYTHRQRSDRGALARLLHRMFVLLPFEEALFTGGTARSDGGSAGRWCQFVGHPAVEDFLEFHGQFDDDESDAHGRRWDEPVYSGDSGRDTESAQLRVAPGALLDFTMFDPEQLARQAAVFRSLMATRATAAAAQRNALGIPEDAFVICALVGSRENEVAHTTQLMIEGIASFRKAQEATAAPTRQIVVVFPTIAAVETRVKRELQAYAGDAVNALVLTDLSAPERLRLFQQTPFLQSADAAVAVSGTIVTETTLAALPTVVVYRANRLTELLAARLAAVRFVSIPNLLLGRAVVPELLFRECTAANIDAALRRILEEAASPSPAQSPLELPAALSTLTQWTSSGPRCRPMRKCPALHITGPFNIQLVARDNEVKVIERNLRTSGTFPFTSKTFDLNVINLATKAMLGLPVKSVPIALTDIDYVGIKAPQFSFTRLHGADPTLGVEMASAGEVACFGTDMHEAYLKAR